MSPLVCTIIVSGQLSEGFSGAFGTLTLSHQSATTRLCGTLVDQAELEGVLRQLFNLGLEIRSIVTHPGEQGHG
jgi:hypothetical protein